MSSRWLLLQLADGTFPSGAFAHSSGLEAHAILDQAFHLDAFLDASVRQIGAYALPFVRGAAEAPARLAALDDACDATMTLRGPNHASRAQGRALAAAAARVWDDCRPIGDHAGSGPAHHAPVFGAIHGVLGLSADDTAAAYLHGCARGILSAAVRLGLAGTLEAQRALANRAHLFESLLAAREEAPAQTAPLLEIFAALHERLDGRMFQS